MTKLKIKKTKNTYNSLFSYDREEHISREVDTQNDDYYDRYAEIDAPRGEKRTLSDDGAAASPKKKKISNELNLDELLDLLVTAENKSEKYLKNIIKTKTSRDHATLNRFLIDHVRECELYDESFVVHSFGHRSRFVVNCVNQLLFKIVWSVMITQKMKSLASLFDVFFENMALPEKVFNRNWGDFDVSVLLARIKTRILHYTFSTRSADFKFTEKCEFDKMVRTKFTRDQVMTINELAMRLLANFTELLPDCVDLPTGNVDCPIRKNIEEAATVNPSLSNLFKISYNLSITSGEDLPKKMMLFLDCGLEDALLELEKLDNVIASPYDLFYSIFTRTPIVE